MISYLYYMLIFHGILLIVYFIASLIKGYYPDNIKCYIPICGIYSIILNILILYEDDIEFKSAMDKAAAKVEKNNEVSAEYIKLSSREVVVNRIFMKHVPNIYDFIKNNENNGISNAYHFNETIARSNCQGKINMVVLANSNFNYTFNYHEREKTCILLSKFVSTFKYAAKIKDYNSITSVYTNMIETLAEIAKEGTILTDKLHAEMMELISNYVETFDRLIQEEDKKRKTELDKKIETQDNFLIEKIKRTNEVLNEMKN